MSEFKGTKGEWYRNTESRIVSSVYSRNEQKLIHISGGNTEEKKANAQLIAHAPQMLEMLIEAKQQLQSIKLSMMAHPDCTEGSEFDDYTTSAQECEDEIEKLIQQATTIK